MDTQTRENLHVAVVHGSDAVLYLATGPTRASVLRQLARYVADNANRQLWEDEARRVAELLEKGAADDAVQLYFDALAGPPSRVRWEREWLVVRSLPLPGAAALVE